MLALIARPSTRKTTTSRKSWIGSSPRRTGRLCGWQKRAPSRHNGLWARVVGAMTDSPILLELAGPLARITLNRPAVLNAMTPEWVRAFEAAVGRVAAAPEVRVLVIRGAGRAF